MSKKKLLLIFTIGLMYACGSSDENEPIITDSFDRGVMLTHLADNIITPSYADFSSDMTALKTAGTTFTNSPEQASLDALRSSWLTAYKTWQSIEMFNIGKADELQYRFYMNVYPLAVADVESNIASVSYELDNVNYQDAQGFPALDYLLYGVADSDVLILEKYTTAANNENYKQYLTDVLIRMDGLTQQVVTDWSTDRNDFVNSTENTVTSALNMFLNAYIQYYEKNLRANKFGIPAGIFSSAPLPEKVEALYSKDVSRELALDALEAFTDFFDGKYKGNATANRSSFKQYLEALNRADLAASINRQLASAKSEIESLNLSFADQVNTDNSKMTRAYDELQKLVVLLKVDMASALNISVVFVDNDGD
jgi:predicted lipoprotein